MAVAAPELSNIAIAEAFEELGDLYELDGAIVHRVLAYRSAAKAVREARAEHRRMVRGFAEVVDADGDGLGREQSAAVGRGSGLRQQEGMT